MLITVFPVFPTLIFVTTKAKLLYETNGDSENAFWLALKAFRGILGKNCSMTEVIYKTPLLRRHLILRHT